MSTLPFAPTTINLVVFGRPQQVGSKSPWVPKHADGSPVTKNGRIVVATMDSNKKSKPWMAAVRSAAGEVFSGDLLTGPLKLSVEFFFSRPKSHFRGGKNAHLLRDGAPEWHAQTPDLDKLVRAIGDGMKGVVYRDDSQIVRFGETGRHWTTGQERAEITLTVLEWP